MLAHIHVARYVIALRYRLLRNDCFKEEENVMIKLLAVSVIVAAGSVASAQVDSVWHGAVPDNGPDFRTTFDYQSDDGSSENSVGLTAGGVLGWYNQFTADGGLQPIAEIGLCFGTPLYPNSSGVTVGQSFGVGVLSDPNNDGDPTDAVFLSQAVGQIAAGSIDTDVKQIVDIPDVTIAAGSSFFLVAWLEHAAGGYPAPLDQDSGYVIGRSWVTGGDGPFDPNSFPTSIGIMENNSIGLPGYWLLSANVPAPGTAALLGLGALAIRRRR
ncbi:MAG: hypothetical protein KAS72_15005 [Phycisphaerales bacterium]|nr:hypothetical protein [Phycisphaerales bacterium]